MEGLRRIRSAIFNPRTAHEAWLVIQSCFLIATLTVSVLIYALCIGVTLPQIFQNYPLLRYISYIVATWLVSGVWIHFFMVLLRDSQVPDTLKIRFHTVPHQVMEKIRDAEKSLLEGGTSGNPLDKITGESCPWRPCYDCEAFVPRRSWHCADCQQCSLRRDHHCAVAKTCVGEKNHVNFLGFVFYAAMGTFLASGTGFVLVCLKEGPACLLGFLKSTCFLYLFFGEPPFINSFCKFIIMWVFFGSVLVFTVLFRYLRQALKNQTSYENKHSKKFPKGNYSLAHLNEFIGPRPILTILVPFCVSPYQAEYNTKKTFSDLLVELGEQPHEYM